MTNDGLIFLNLCSDHEDLDIYEAQTIQDLITFRWERFCFAHHFFGWLINIVYLLLLELYTVRVYVNGNVEPIFNWTMIVIISYPAIYEIRQMFSLGVCEYLSDTSNYIDLGYIWGSIAMAIVH